MARIIEITPPMLAALTIVAAPRAMLVNGARFQTEKLPTPGVQIVDVPVAIRDDSLQLFLDVPRQLLRHPTAVWMGVAAAGLVENAESALRAIPIRR
ncbi:MAG: hypothetical protein M3T55_01525 [Pseudomonadota bacterium]|nr:hypothetical protein [Pseudomonadota bacterium]